MPINPLDPTVNGEPYAEHPRQRASDHSKLARVAEGYRLYEPFVELLWKLGLPLLLLSWFTGLVKAPGNITQVQQAVQNEIRRSMAEDSLSRVDRAALDARMTKVEARSEDTFRAVCFQLDAFGRNALDCPRDLPPRP